MTDCSESGTEAAVSNTHMEPSHYLMKSHILEIINSTVSNVVFLAVCICYNNVF